MDAGTVAAIAVGIFTVLALFLAVPLLRRGQVTATLDVQAKQIQALETARAFDKTQCDEMLNRQASELGRLRGRLDTLESSFVDRIAEASANKTMSLVKAALEGLINDK